MQDNREVTKSAGLVGLLTLLSRILGYIRDMMMAWFFGAGLFSDVFIAVFRIPDFSRRLFNEGAFGVAFIPVFTRYLTRQNPEAAHEFAAATFRFLLVLLGGMVVAGVFCAPLVVYLIAPGFAGFPEKFNLAVILVNIMLPYIGFIGLAALCMGILNGLGHFAAPALAPALLNLTMIGSMLFMAGISSDNTVRILGLSGGVILGGGLQLMSQLAVLLKRGVRLIKPGRFFHPGIKDVARSMAPAVFGLSVFQINVLLDTFLASLLGEGAISYLYYADRLIQFPLGIFAVSISTAVYPMIARQAALKDTAALIDSLNHSLELVLFVSVPSMVGLIVMREPIVALLFKRGTFDASMTRLTALALLYYGIGIWAFAAVRVVVSVFYAMGDARTPVKAGIAAIVMNLCLGILFMRMMSYGGLALATSLASMLNLWLLADALKRKIGKLRTASVVQSVCRSGLCAVLMGGVVHLFLPSGDMGTTLLALRVCGCILTGFSVYAALSFVLNRATLLRAVKIMK